MTHPDHTDNTVASADTEASAPGATAATGTPTPPPRARAAPLPLGTLVDRYELGERLGAGGMGVVYRARDPKLARDVALKLVAVSGLADAQARLEREAQMMARLTHPNVCTVHELGAWNGQLFVSMELCTGGTLAAWLREPHGWRDRVRVLVAAGRGLAAAHELGIVHRDFKPDNVMRTADGLVKVTDFGLARSVADRGDIEGTPAYMAPEQLVGGDLDARSDQFAFGVTAWQVLCGCLPFQPDPSGRDIYDRLLRAIQSRRRVRASDRDATATPARVVRLLERALEPEPAQRWPKLADLLDALEAAARPRTRYAVVAGIAVVAAAAAAAIAYAAVPDKQPLLFPPAPALSPVYGALMSIGADRMGGAVDDRVELLRRGFARTGDDRFLLETARMLLAANGSQLALLEPAQTLDCSGLVPYDTYRQAHPEWSELALDQLAVRTRAWCLTRDREATTTNVDELEAMVENGFRSGESDKAVSALHRLLELQPDDYVRWRTLGDIYLGNGYCKKAKLAYDKFVAKLPAAEHPESWQKGITSSLATCQPAEHEPPGPP